MKNNHFYSILESLASGDMDIDEAYRQLRILPN
jgi:hypothetical protein